MKNKDNLVGQLKLIFDLDEDTEMYQLLPHFAGVHSFEIKQV